jgi:hypothetical protein
MAANYCGICFITWPRANVIKLFYRGNSIILSYKDILHLSLLWNRSKITGVKSFITLSHGGKLKYRSNLLHNFNPRKYQYCGNLPQYFHNIGPIQWILKGKYHFTVDLLFEWLGVSCMTTDNFVFIFKTD